jgi:hypothetical protein
VSVIVVDYVLLAVERNLSDQGLDPSRHLRLAIPAFVDAARLQLAGRFNTSVWLLQQFNTTANKKSPVAKMTYGDAAEAGARFVHNLTFCAALGTKDIETNCTLLSFPKRRRAGDAQQSRILQIDPTFHRLNDATQNYAIDRACSRIVSAEMLQQIGGPAPGRQSNQSLDIGGVLG